jgi:large subunit ribosomal protein L28
MAKCYICGKTTTFGKQVSMSRSHVSGRSNRKVKPNLKRTKIVEDGKTKTVDICTRCLRSNIVERKAR